MSTITTAAELDALPVGSVVRDRQGDDWTKRLNGVWTTPETAPFASPWLARKWGPFTPRRDAAADTVPAALPTSSSNWQTMTQDPYVTPAVPAVDQGLREARAIIAAAVRRNCTPSSEAYVAGGDRLIYAVADWIENPPEWVKFGEAAQAAAVPVHEALRERVLDATVRSHLDAMHESLGSVPFDEVSDRTKRLIRSQVSGIVDRALAAVGAEVEALRAENERLRAFITDTTFAAGLIAERDEARATKDMHKERAAAALAREGALRAGVETIHRVADYDVQGWQVCAECVSPDDWTVTSFPEDLVWPCATYRLLAEPGGES